MSSTSSTSSTTWEDLLGDEAQALLRLCLAKVMGHRYGRVWLEIQDGEVTYIHEDISHQVPRKPSKKLPKPLQASPI